MVKETEKGKDPVRFPTQIVIERLFKSNYEKSLQVSKVRIAKILKNKQKHG